MIGKVVISEVLLTPLNNLYNMDLIETLERQGPEWQYWEV